MNISPFEYTYACMQYVGECIGGLKLRVYERSSKVV